MPSEIDVLAFSQLVERFGQSADTWRDWLNDHDIGSGGGGGPQPWIDLGKRGIDMTGATGGHKAAIEAIVAEAGAEIADHNGRRLTGFGVVQVDQTIELQHANCDLFGVRFQARKASSGVAAFGGVMLKLGRYVSGGNGSRLSVPHKQELWAWGGDPAVGINSAATCFQIDNDQSPGGEYHLKGGYAGVGLHLVGNVEKKQIHFEGAYLDLVARNQASTVGSADSMGVKLVVSNYSGRLIESLYQLGNGGNDTSIVWSGYAEGYRAAPGFIGAAIRDENGKAASYNLVIRGYDGQAGLPAQAANAYYSFNQPAGANDYADTIFFGGENRHIAFHGCALRIESVQGISGTFNLRDSSDAWTTVNTSSGDGLGPLVPTPAVFVGRVVSGGEFHLSLRDVINTPAVRYGDDTWYSTGCDFGSAAVTCGYFKPFTGTYPLEFIALHFYRAVNCSFVFSQVHGQIQIGAQILACRIRMPVTWALIGYAATIAPAAVFTLTLWGGCTFDEARAAPIVRQIAGEQVLVVEGLSDVDGYPASYTRGRWRLAGPHIGSTLALSALASNVNRDFKEAGLPFTCRSDVAGAGAAVGHSFVALGDAPGDGWVDQRTGGVIAVGEMGETAAYLARAGAAPSAAWRAIYDRLLYRLKDGGYLQHGVMTHLLGMETAAQSRLALFPAVSGSWYDATVSGAPVWTKGQGYAFRPSVFTFAVPAAAGDTVMINSQVITFVAGAPGAGQVQIGAAGPVTIDGTVVTLTAIQRSAYNLYAYIQANAVAIGVLGATWSGSRSSNSCTLLGNDQVVTTAGTTPPTYSGINYLATGYDFGVSAEGLARNDMMLLSYARRENPAALGSQNGWEFGARNGNAKINGRNGNAKFAAGGTATTDFPAAQILMPQLLMGARVSNGVQIGVVDGRVASTGNLFSVGDPDAFEIGRAAGAASSREIWATGLFRASGVIAQRDGVLGLHRAYLEAFKAAQALL